MAVIVVVFCFHANSPLWPRSRLNIPLNFTFESEAIGANLHGNKTILKWRPFWNKVYNKAIAIVTSRDMMSVFLNEDRVLSND